MTVWRQKNTNDLFFNFADDSQINTSCEEGVWTHFQIDVIFDFTKPMFPTINFWKNGKKNDGYHFDFTPLGNPDKPAYIGVSQK